MFADRKMALGFAGVTIVIAIVAALSVGMFLPASDGPRGEDQIVEGAPEGEAPRPAQAAAAPQAAPTWSDEGSADDDWGPSSMASGNGANGWVSDNDRTGENEIEFGTYNPEPRSSASRPSPGPRVASNSGSQRGERGQPTVTTSAAPGAPSLSPPGGRGSGEDGTVGRN